jgi:hypothetical protein
MVCHGAMRLDDDGELATPYCMNAHLVNQVFAKVEDVEGATFQPHHIDFTLHSCMVAQHTRRRNQPLAENERDRTDEHTRDGATGTPHQTPRRMLGLHHLQKSRSTRLETSLHSTGLLSDSQLPTLMDAAMSPDLQSSCQLCMGSTGSGADPPPCPSGQEKNIIRFRAGGRMYFKKSIKQACTAAFIELV